MLEHLRDSDIGFMDITSTEHTAKALTNMDN